MPDQVLEVLALFAKLLELFGASSLVLGFVIATFTCCRQYFGEGAESAIKRYRQKLGRTVLIGLEIMVAATIIKTVTLEPTAKSIGFLSIMIAVRTILGWTMVLEVNGRWPWQTTPPSDAQARMPS